VKEFKRFVILSGRKDLMRFFTAFRMTPWGLFIAMTLGRFLGCRAWMTSILQMNQE
jgi:FtsH-binding integral membrane protein